jgi:hypothetical protein
MSIAKSILLGAVLLMGFTQVAFSQSFKNWEGESFMDDASNAHSIYRQAIKSEDWALAFENWQKAYELAPAADGKRDYHFIDGVKIYINKFQNETDAAKKEEYKTTIDRLYDEAIAAYEDGSVVPTKCVGKPECIQSKIGYVYGRKAYDMFYTLNSPYSKNLESLNKAIELSGNDVEYTVFDPLASIVVYQFQKGKIEKEKAVEYFQQMEGIAEYNLENNERLGAYYDQAWKAAQTKFGPIETEIFDCDYFKPKYKALYDADPENMDQLKNLVGLLKKRGCAADDPLLVELDGKWKTYAATTNAARKAEFEANNPAILAKKAYDAGDYAGAVSKYNEAINAETDPSKKAGYMFSKASIQGRKLKKYSDARKTALAAAKLRPNYGRPYMLIGDLYATSARNCGDSWNQRLAIIAAIDKYNYAKSIDPTVAEEAGKKASKYRSSLPDSNEGFMRGVKKGDTEKVGCWIGENVKVRYQ